VYTLRASKQNQDTLNKIIWPEVYTLIKFTAKKAALDDIDLFVVDAALLLEAGYARYFDSILLITAQKSIRIKRIQLRNNIPDDQIEKRMALQMPESEKQELASTTIENNTDVQDLYMKLDHFYKNLYVK
jgi:dephospho-CoA kinase